MRSKLSHKSSLIFLASTVLILLILSMNSRQTLGATITEWNTPAPGNNPQHLVADNAGSIWFSEFGTDQIGRYSFGGFSQYYLPGGSAPMGIGFEPTKSLVWFTESKGKIGSLSSGGAYTEYTIHAGPSLGLWGIAVANATLIWFTESQNQAVGCLYFPEISPNVPQVIEWSIPGGTPLRSVGNGLSQPQDILYDSSTGVWFTDYQQSRIGNIQKIGYNATSNVIREWYLPNPNSAPWGIAEDTNGNIWFTESGTDRIGKLNPYTNEITEYLTPTTGSQPYGIAIDNSNKVWFAEHGQNAIGRFTPGQNTMTEFKKSINGAPAFIATSWQGYTPIWFTDSAYSRLGEVDPFSGSFTTVFSNALSSATTTSTTTAVTITSLSGSSFSNQAIAATTNYGLSQSATTTTSTSYTIPETITLVESSTLALSTISSTTVQTATSFTTVPKTLTSYVDTVTGTLTTTTFATATSYISTTTATGTTTSTSIVTSFSTIFETTTASTSAAAVPGFTEPSILTGLFIGGIIILFYRSLGKKDVRLWRK